MRYKYRLLTYPPILLSYIIKQPLNSSIKLLNQNFNHGELTDNQFWFQIFLIVFLVLLGGLLAGLTLGLMSLDTTTLHILSTSTDARQRKLASKVAPIRKDAHLLLVTLMLANTLTNMSLPILIDKLFGDGLQAVLISTGLILIFGEVLPQAICARHALEIGAAFAWAVQLLIYIMYPIAYPFAKTLDYLLGEHHGVMYRRAELKELVSIHSDTRGGSLNNDEVTIIRGALDLSSKTTAQVMTPLEHVFMVDLECELDAITLRDIARAGHSRIPVYKNQRENIVGLLLTKSLILINPKLSTPLKKVKIHPLPNVDMEMPLFDLLNTFQEGTSHMAIVTSKESKPLGIITLEDVIEELIQEEIIDETDVYVDVAKKIRATRTLPNAVFGKPNVNTNPIKNKSKEQPLVFECNNKKEFHNDKLGKKSNIFSTPRASIDLNSATCNIGVNRSLSLDVAKSTSPTMEDHIDAKDENNNENNTNVLDHEFKVGSI